MPSPKLCILCVDDDDDISALIEVMLQYSNADYKITSVRTAEDGLRLAATEAFDLYVLDYDLSHKSGVEICRRVRQTDAQVPIMFFTGEDHEPERREAMDAGANAYLVKPDDLGILTETAKRLLGAEKLAPRTQ